MFKIKYTLCTLAALAIAWPLVSPVSAQPNPEGQENPAPARQAAPKGNPCMDDAQKFCPDASSVGDRLKCLKEHETDLSAPCKEAREKAKQVARRRVSRAKETCQSDIEKFCKDVKEGEGRIVACLKVHVDDLTPSCKIAYDKIDIQIQKRQIIKNKAPGQQ